MTEWNLYHDMQNRSYNDVKKIESLEDKIELYEEILDLFDVDTLSKSKYNEFVKLYKRIGEIK